MGITGVTASSTALGLAANVDDEDFTTSWTSALVDKAPTITINSAALTAASALHGVLLYWADNASRNFSVQYCTGAAACTSSSSWTTPSNGTFTSDTNPIDFVKIPTVTIANTAFFSIRVVGSNPGGNVAYTLSELEAF